MPIFLYIKLKSHAGPISKNCKSSKNDGFLPSILWPTNWPIHAMIKIESDNLHIVGSKSSIQLMEAIIPIAINSIPTAIEIESLK